MKRMVNSNRIYLLIFFVMYQWGYSMSYMQIKESPLASSSDIVNTEKYMKFSIDPHLTNQPQDIEYFYVESDMCDLAKFKEDFNLEFISNEEQDQSTHTIQEMKYSERDSCIYTIQVKYLCPENKYLINYQLSLQDKADSVNKWQIYWKKICTETKIPRNGLNIDVELNDSKERIPLVYNGVSIPNYVLSLDKSTEKARFIVYLSNQTQDNEEMEQKIKEQEQQEQSEEQKEQQPEGSDGQKEAEKKSNLVLLKNMVMQINEEIIQKPLLYYNKQEVEIKLKGNLSKGGVISKQGDFDQSIREENIIMLEFDCLSAGDTELELLVPLVHFDDIKVAINKTCGINIKEEMIQIERRIGLELIFFIVFLLFTLTHFLYSMLVKNQNVIQSYPFLLSLVHFLLQRSFIQRNQKWNDFLTGIYRQQGQNDSKKPIIADETSRLNQSQNFNPTQSYVNDENENNYNNNNNNTINIEYQYDEEQYQNNQNAEYNQCNEINDQDQQQEQQYQQDQQKEYQYQQDQQQQAVEVIDYGYI